MTTFVDRVTLYAAAGKGGDGCVSVKREKFKPLGGPDGGNGGRGGDVILIVDQDTTTLLDFHHSPHRRGTNGSLGYGDYCNGKEGKDLILHVPNGTVIKDSTGTVLADLVGFGTRFIAAQGGKGGLGNTRFKSSTNRAPRKFTKGGIGEEFTIWLQLKTIADIGIIGLPNAGKSSLLAAITNANPKIANYRFTTLNPNLGVASYDDKEITIADIPGLVEGAHEGVGLGIQFLKHIERCKSLLHLIDITNLDLNDSYEQVKNELKNYSSYYKYISNYF